MTSGPHELRLSGWAEAYRSGWFQEDQDAILDYEVLLNDLSEDIEIKGRLTKLKLCELVGYLQAENAKAAVRLNDLRDSLSLLLAKSMR